VAIEVEAQLQLCPQALVQVSRGGYECGEAADLRYMRSTAHTHHA
jgi:hypothetical protein